jgi:hypothetical protein
MKAGGFPFYWAQVLCGLEVPLPYELTLSKTGTWVETKQGAKPFLGQIVGLLLERRKQLVELNTVLARMSMGKITLPGLESEKPKGKIMALKRDQVCLKLIL